MDKRQSDVSRLDQAINALEQLVLSASDREILAEGSTEVRYVKEIIDKSIAECDTSTVRSGTSEQHMRPKSKKRHSQTLGDLQAKITFFRNLMTTRPDLSPRLGAVFGAGRTPTSEELNDLTDELIGLGQISKNSIKKK